MKINCLLVSLIAGTCASAAFAGGDDVTKALTPHKVDKVYMHGLINGNGSGFGTRGDPMDVYSNVDLGGNSWIFYGGTVHTSGDPIFMEKGGYSSFGVNVGPVASPAKVGIFEFWIVASDGTTGSHGVPCTITYEMFDTQVDWNPLSTTAVPNTCMPSGDDSVNQVSLGGFYVPLTGAFAPLNGFANGYILDLGGAGLAWTLTDGNAFIDNRCWDNNGTNPPVAISATVYNCYDGSAAVCGAPAGAYPALGFSVDNFYFDADSNGIYRRNERYFYGGFPFIANLMFRLQADDGCTLDLNGDGFVNGDDIGYAGFVFDGGCPY